MTTHDEGTDGSVADDLDLTEVWTRALDSLGDEGMTAQQRAFVSLTRPLAIVEDTALVAAPNEFTKDVLESKLRPMVVDALSRTLGREIRIAVTVDMIATGTDIKPLEWCFSCARSNPGASSSR